VSTKVVSRLRKIVAHAQGATDYADLLTTDTIKKYCDEHGHPSLVAALCRDFTMLIKLMDPSMDVADLNTLWTLTSTQRLDRASQLLELSKIARCAQHWADL
jgi:hypothetical protein